MRRTLVLAALAFSTVAATAQTTATGQPAQIYLNGSVASLTAQSSCPIGFRAQLSTGPGMVIVDSGTHAPISQQLHLSFQNPNQLGITSMRVTVHGLTPKGQVVPAVTTASDAPGTVDTPATLNLPIAPRSDNSTQLSVRGITSVRSLDLDEVTYTDGTVWHASAAHACHIEPNRLMLVASH